MYFLSFHDWLRTLCWFFSIKMIFSVGYLDMGSITYYGSHRGEGWVSQFLFISDKGGRGGYPISDLSDKGGGGLAYFWFLLTRGGCVLKNIRNGQNTYCFSQNFIHFEPNFVSNILLLPFLNSNFFLKDRFN